MAYVEQPCRQRCVEQTCFDRHRGGEEVVLAACKDEHLRAHTFN